MTYADGVCHQVRIRRNGSKPSLIRSLTNLVSDLSIYVSDLFNRAQANQNILRVSDNRPTVDQIRDLMDIKTPERTPLIITDPQNQQSTNSGITDVAGTYVESINFDGITVNDEQANATAGGFDISLPIDDDVFAIGAVADYGRRSYSAQILIEIDSDSPVVVSAASTSSTSVVIQFNEPMSDNSIASTANFNIVRDDNNGTLPVSAVQFVDESQSSVLLSTGLQSDVDYMVTVVNVTDQAGNTISGRLEEVEGEPSIAFFVGTAPTGDEVIDSDGDGILDHIELDGWPVIIVRTDGTTETIIVTSDPFNADTDGDGIPDSEERHAGSNPRSNDTDGDTLSDYDEWNIIYSNPVDQDTDDDGIQDGFEYLFFKTSPILADTDGDQIDDPTELAAGNRNPLVADLPSPDISVGNVNLQLDTRFTFTDEEGTQRTDDKTVETTLSQGEDSSFSSANEASTSNTLQFSESISTTIGYEVSAKAQFGTDPSIGGEVKHSGSVTTAFGSEQGSEKGSTNSFGEESSQNSEETYHDSLTSSLSKSATETVTREVLGASMKVDLTIANAGDIPFTVSNLELTAQTQDPRNRRRLIPVASLTPENASLGSVNIGVLGDPSRGPFVFSTGSENVFPQEIEELMKSPRGLVIQLANFDIVDQEGNNFAYSSQEVLDRTVGITFDSGNGGNESYRVATASEHDENTGEPVGITMARALEIAGFSRYATVRDGGNGIVETLANGDDDQSQALFSTIEPLTTFITVGDNEELDTIILGGDDVIIEADYETELFGETSFLIDGGNGINDTQAPTLTTLDPNNDDVGISTYQSIVEPGQILVRPGPNEVIDTIPNQDLAGNPTIRPDLGPDYAPDDIIIPAGPKREVLVRFRDTVASADELKFWVLFSENQVVGVNLDDLVLRSGQQYDFAYIQDADEDGVWAREEYLHGSSDNKTNTDGCDQDFPPNPCDTLGDFAEIQTGWYVQLKSSLQGYQVYSNPNQGDSDRDGLTDATEMACGLDPRQRDTDLDGLSDKQELLGLQILDGDYVYMASIDPDDIADEVIISVYAGDEPTILPESLSSAPVYVNHPLNAACDAALLIDSALQNDINMGKLPNGFMLNSGYATDPLDADTDGDFINDLEELQLGLHPNDSSDAGDFLDDDGDGLPNSLERNGWEVRINGAATGTVKRSEPDKVDTDSDRLPDLLEYFLGSDPSNPDTDGDGISDTDEYKNDGLGCVGVPSGECEEFRDSVTMGYARFEQECEAAEVCSISAIESDLSAAISRQLGTNLNQSDTDGDGVDDNIELSARTIQVDGLDIGGILSDPLAVDTDGDDVDDGDEYDEGTNPNVADTDGDGRNDRAEIDNGFTDATYRDKQITVDVLRFKFRVETNNLTFSVLGQSYCSQTNGNTGDGNGGINEVVRLASNFTNNPLPTTYPYNLGCANPRIVNKQVIKFNEVRRITMRGLLNSNASLPNGGTLCTPEKFIEIGYNTPTGDIDTEFANPSAYGNGGFVNEDSSDDLINRCSGNDSRNRFSVQFRFSEG